MRRMKVYVHEKAGWPHLTWDNEVLLPLLGNVRNNQGRLLGKMRAVGFEMQTEALLKTLSTDVLKSTEIEGINYNPEQVRSSVAKRLGMNITSSSCSF